MTSVVDFRALVNARLDQLDSDPTKIMLKSVDGTPLHVLWHKEDADKGAQGRTPRGTPKRARTAVTHTRTHLDQWLKGRPGRTLHPARLALLLLALDLMFVCSVCKGTVGQEPVDFRTLIEARMKQRGLGYAAVVRIPVEDGQFYELWGTDPRAAETHLGEWLRGVAGRSMQPERLALLLAVLDLRIVCAGCDQEQAACTCGGEVQRKGRAEMCRCAEGALRLPTPG